MFYVEWLRVRNCLRVLAVVLGVIFAITVLVRLFMPTNLDESHYVHYELNAAGAHVKTVHLKNGTTRTTILDTEGDRVVVTDRGWRGKHITVSGPNVDVGGTATRVQVGSVRVNSAPGTNGGRVEVNTDEPIPFDALLIGPAIIGIIVATILGGVLGKENRNHLEIAWTKPVSREGMALGLFAVDALGIVGAMLLALVLELAGIALFEMPRITVDSSTLPTIGLVLFGILAFYALFDAASASVRGGGGMKALVWLAVIFVPPLSAAALVPILIFKIIGTVFGALALLDPLAYLSTNVNDSGHVTTSAIPGVFGYDILSSQMWERALILVGLAILYLALSLVQWRRLEA
jgi:hypothetical protein